MVKDGAQLYTMEGVAAGLIMLLTAYLVLGSTSVYTPGDTHITDMQLEQVGSDILRVMDTPRILTSSLRSNRTDLELLVTTTDSTSFYNSFIGDYLCRATGPTPVGRDITVGCTDFEINASIWYMNNTGTGNLGSYLLLNFVQPEAYTGTGPGVRVTHWISTNSKPSGSVPADMRPEPQVVLMEVVMWKA
ncbi:MAG TPA: hypothetical protein VKO45_07195 [Methanomicrobiales archaeon]|nr:hypothetical protein [Methanomicrobiales archaeon]